MVHGHACARQEREQNLAIIKELMQRAAALDDDCTDRRNLISHRLLSSSLMYGAPYHSCAGGLRDMELADAEETRRRRMYQY